RKLRNGPQLVRRAHVAGVARRLLDCRRALQPGPHVRGTPGAEPGPGVLCRRRFAAATWFAVASQASAGANQRRCPEAIGLSSTECSGERIFSVAAARAACYAMHVRGPPP